MLQGKKKDIYDWSEVSLKIRFSFWSHYSSSKYTLVVYS